MKPDGIYSAFYNPVSSDIFVGNGTGKLFMLDSSFAILDTVQLAAGPISLTLSSQDGKFMCNPSADGNLYVWDVTGDSLKLVLKEKTNASYSITAMFSHQQHFLLSTGIDSSIAVYDWLNKKMAYRIKSDAVIRFAWFKEDDTEIFWVNDKGCLFCNKFGTREPYKSVKISDLPLNCIVYDSVLKEILVTSDDYFCYVIDYPTLKVKQRFSPCEGPVFVGLWSPDHTTIATSGFDGVIKLWVRKQGRYVLKKQFKAHEGLICSLYFNAKGDKILTAGQDGWMKEWSAESCRLLKSIDFNKDEQKNI